MKTWSEGTGPQRRTHSAASAKLWALVWYFSVCFCLAFHRNSVSVKEKQNKDLLPQGQIHPGHDLPAEFYLMANGKHKNLLTWKKTEFLLLFVIENMHSFSHGHLDFQHHSHPVPFLPVDTADTRIAWEGSTRSKKRPYKMITLQLDKISWASASTLGISSKNNREPRLEVYWCAFECPWKSNVLLRWCFNLRSRPQWISNQSTDFVNTKGS